MDRKSENNEKLIFFHFLCLLMQVEHWQKQQQHHQHLLSEHCSPTQHPARLHPLSPPTTLNE